MHNPNTNAVTTSFRNNRYSASNHSTSRVVHIGNDQQHVNLAKMASIKSGAWKTSASFGTLADTVGSLIGAHYVAGVISPVSTDIHIDTGSLFQESQSATKLIVHSILSIDFSDPVAWHVRGYQSKISYPADLKTRLVHI